MKRKYSPWTTVLAAVGLAAAGGLTVCHARGHSPDPEVIVEWNEILEGVLPASGLAPPRNYAMLHIAMFDAVNSIERSHLPYRLRVPAWPSASQEAAAAQAAHDILAANFPTSIATYDAALQARLANPPPRLRRAGHPRRPGRRRRHPRLAPERRWNVPPAPYVLPPFPGQYQPTPPTFGPPSFRQFETTEPFALLTATQYQPVGPPTLTSQEYADSLNQVQTIGSATSMARTAEQTMLARSFASVTNRTIHWGLWNHVARDTARARRLSLIETARLYALLNVSIHDGLQTLHSSKFVYGRVATGDRNPPRGRASNDLTVADLMRRCRR